MDKTFELIRKMRKALEKADRFLVGFEDDETQEDLSAIPMVREALDESAQWMNSAIFSAIQSPPRYVAVIIEGGHLQDFVTNIPDEDITYLVVDYDGDRDEEEPVFVTSRAGGVINMPLSEAIGKARFISWRETEAIKQLKELGF